MPPTAPGLASPSAGGATSSGCRAYEPPRGMVASVNFNERFVKLIRGHWLDSIGNSIIVSKYSEEQQLTAVLTPLIDHSEARDRVFTIRHDRAKTWRCGNANLEWADEHQQRLVWITEDGRRSVWSRTVDQVGIADDGVAFPWLLNYSVPEPWLPLHDVPRDILYDGARVAALLDIRQMIGPRSDPQERLTHILMDHDLHRMRGDFLVPCADSPLWQTLPVSEVLRENIKQRIQRIPHEALSQRVTWCSDTEILVGQHKISVRTRDIQVLESRWVLPQKDERKSLEIARLLSLYSVFDNPLSNRRNGVHLGLDPELRRQCDYELFASPLNAACPNGHFASKWPHVEWRFGSIGSYPTVISSLPPNAVVCVNPPFTEAYLADVMNRLTELKLRFRLRIAVPIQEVPWRKKLLSSLPSARLLRTYYDASSDHTTDVLHPTLLWEDPRCTPARLGGNTLEVSYNGDGETQPLETPWPPQAADANKNSTAEVPPAIDVASTAVAPMSDTSVSGLMPPAMAAVTAHVLLPATAVQHDMSTGVVLVAAAVGPSMNGSSSPANPSDLAPSVSSEPTSPHTENSVLVSEEFGHDRISTSLSAAASIAKRRSASSLGGSGQPRQGGGGPVKAVPGKAVKSAQLEDAPAAPATPAEGEADDERPALDADEWPTLACLKQSSKKSTKAKR